MKITLIRHRHSALRAYHYTVLRENDPWCAYRTLEGVRRFLRDYGLKPVLESRNEELAVFELKGKPFVEHMIWNKEELLRMSGRESYRLSNGEYTLWKIAVGLNGRSLFYLNPNVKDRPTIKYFHE